MDQPPSPRPALIVHAGAWAIPDDEKPAHREGCMRAVRAGWEILVAGGDAGEAARTAVRVLEDAPTLNAGTGSVLARDGQARLDAGIMHGADLSAGAVAGVTRLKNPIEAAEALRRSPHVILMGEDAEAYAREQGQELVAPATLVTDREVSRLRAWQADADAGREHGTDFGPGDTVGAVAVDALGHIVAAASTGGLCGKRVGRMGDTPVPGAGFFADNLLAGAVCTGHGEALLRMGLARRVCELTRDHAAPDATWVAMQEFGDRYQGKGGVVLVARDGGIGFSFNTPAMAVAYMDSELVEPFIGGGV